VNASDLGLVKTPQEKGRLYPSRQPEPGSRINLLGWSRIIYCSGAALFAELGNIAAYG
jgi:hypothetical protein